MAKRKRFRDRIIEISGGVTKAAADTRAVRAYEAGYEDGEDEPPVDGRPYGYRRSISGSIRGFGGLEHDKVLDTVWRVWLMSPLAKRALALTKHPGILDTLACAYAETGDFDKAVELLREKGLAKAAKKASREANEAKSDLFMKF